MLKANHSYFRFFGHYAKHYENFAYVVFTLAVVPYT